jgi:hypothetical protein
MLIPASTVVRFLGRVDSGRRFIWQPSQRS